MIKFQLLEQFRKQDEERNATRAKYDVKVREVGTHLADLRAEYDAILRREVLEGVDLTAEKEQQRVKIEAAEKELEQAEEERAKVYKFLREDREDKCRNGGLITPIDLVKEWNGPHLTKVRETEYQPVINKMAKAKADYLDAVAEYCELYERHKLERDRLHEITKSTRNFLHLPYEFREMPFLHGHEIVRLQDDKLARLSRISGRNI